MKDMVSIGYYPGVVDDIRLAFESKVHKLKHTKQSILRNSSICIEHDQRMKPAPVKTKCGG